MAGGVVDPQVKIVRRFSRVIDDVFPSDAAGRPVVEKSVVKNAVIDGLRLRRRRPSARFHGRRFYGPARFGRTAAARGPGQASRGFGAKGGEVENQQREGQHGGGQYHEEAAAEEHLERERVDPGRKGADGRNAAAFERDVCLQRLLEQKARFAKADVQAAPVEGLGAVLFGGVLPAAARRHDDCLQRPRVAQRIPKPSLETAAAEAPLPGGPHVACDFAKLRQRRRLLCPDAPV